MAESAVGRLDGVPDRVETVLSDFITELKEIGAADLVSVVLFGSAADGSLTPISGVNLMVVLRAFDAERMIRLRDAYLTGQAAIKLELHMMSRGGYISEHDQVIGKKLANIMSGGNMNHTAYVSEQYLIDL